MESIDEDTNNIFDKSKLGEIWHTEASCRLHIMMNWKCVSKCDKNPLGGEEWKESTKTKN